MLYTDGRVANTTTPDGSELTIASGQTIDPPMVFALFDDFGQYYSIDNSSQLTAEGVINTTSGKTPFLSQNKLFTSYLGMFLLKDFIVILGVNQTADIKFTTDAFDSNPTRSDLTYPLSQTINAYFRSCIRGERLTLDGQCIECPENKYLYTPDKVVGCEDCFDDN